MKHSLYIMGTFLILAGLCSGCKEKSLDPGEVVNRYFAALEKGDLKKAYGYLSDRSLVVKTTGTEGQMRFQARPDFETYQRLMQNRPDIEVRGFEKMENLSREDELMVFEVTGSVREQQRNVQRSVAKFLIYLAPDSQGRWSVLLPATPGLKPRGRVSDSVSLEP